MRHVVILIILLCLTFPLHTQDNNRLYDIALQRIKTASETGATSLDLSQLRLTDLPSELWLLPQLESLYLHRNRLRSLPAEIGLLINLQTLSLDFNQLTNLPPEIQQLTYLQGLYVSDNQLTSLPPEIGQLGNLS